MSEQLGIQVRIETQADVAAVTKTTDELNKLAKGGDDLDSSLARLKAQLNQAETAIKGTGDAALPAGEAMGTGMAGGASKLVPAMAAVAAGIGVAKVAFTAWLKENEDVGKSFGNLKEAAESAMSGIATAVLGDGGKISEWIDGLTRSLGGQTEEMKTWGHTAEEMSKLQAEATSNATKQAIADLDAQAKAYERSTDAIKEHYQAVQDDISDESRRAKLQGEEEKAGIDNNSDMSDDEKRQAKADVDERIRKDDKARADLASYEKINEATGLTDAAYAELKRQQAEEKAQEQKGRKLNAAAIADQGAATAEEQSKSSALTPFEDQFAKERARNLKEQAKRLRDEAGGGNPEVEAAKLKEMREGISGKGGAADQLEKAARNEQKVKHNEGRAVQGREESENSRDTIKADNDAAEAKRIQTAGDQTAKSTNEAAETMAKAMEKQARATETAAKTAQDALKKAEALERKISTMKR